MTITFPSDIDTQPGHDPTKVRRSKDGRPYVKHPCPNATRPYATNVGMPWPDDAKGHVWSIDPEVCFDGRVSGKRKGTTKQCPKCKGKGWVEILYTRCTTFVGVMEERTNLERWKLRTTLVGVAVDHALMQELMSADPDDQNQLNHIADQAFEIGDGHLKARKGTDLHELTTYVDQDRPLPPYLTDFETGQVRPVTLQDRADMAAWERTIAEIGAYVISSEVFVVNDEYQIGGTYDRLVDVGFDHVTGALNVNVHPCQRCQRPLILDLKTGRVDYGQGKIAQQLAVYANSDDYDPATGQRTEQDVCTHRGLIVHLPQGTGQARVWVADLEAGWRAVELSSKVREHRRQEKNFLWPIEENTQH